jgi:hypothetical protein
MPRLIQPDLEVDNHKLRELDRLLAEKGGKK